MTQDDSTRPKRQRKAKQERFPLTLHPGGQWCKKVLGKIEYFGRDQDKALAEWLRVKDDLLAGRARRPNEPDKMSLADLCNLFLKSKAGAVETGYLRQRSWNDYKAECERMLRILGRNVAVDHLNESDFGTLRKSLAKGVNFKTLEGRIVRCRAVFRFGERRRLVAPVLHKMEDELRKPPKAAIDREKGDAIKVFEASEIRLLLANANPQMKSMIFLGINCGMGNEDIAQLTVDNLDLERGWLNKRRAKTGKSRRIPLWKETVDAIQAVLDSRNGEKSKAERLFMTKFGATFNANTKANPISSEFRKLRLSLGIDSSAKTFYTLRHSFKTIGENATGNNVGVDALMGHIDASVSGIYRQFITDERLLEITNAVRTWLFESDKPKAEPKRKPRGK
ncbi:MAG: tyrosine-type recombinase/integrase [Planctomycetota bacterium]